MSEIKVFSKADLAQHATRDSLYLAIAGKVYDCTSFVDEHPGGEEVMFDEAGKDATESFEDVGHSEEARELLQKMYIGEYKNDDSSQKTKAPSMTPKPIPASDNSESGSGTPYILGLAIIAGAVLWKFLL
ncbi:cytochrome b5-like heme/steroid binding domain-containing protein [Lobosporangium transversale]|uniref:Cytochrome b5-like heme/steroid binding domain-containing protein n=1 Tax=Lobosporangium transversale TaxID=64571 RepID=A0A1Y2GK50_9FUNG|nr:cytochrome b5-like heme/steroid binding domain-containing protein [Lobosporangium transversale]ORZ12037.1 cytochrome b5-like heme/steroid binding domain-containing protein [Lobosporangium transversale]|eukprot:XP_021879902.1 cytochrome b5-like heme/steroid binding domain-containing protein [Lobosporangium transversale]